MGEMPRANMYTSDIGKSVLEILRRNFVKFRKRQRTEEMHGTEGWELRSCARGASREMCRRGAGRGCARDRREAGGDGSKFAGEGKWWEISRSSACMKGEFSGTKRISSRAERRAREKGGGG